MEEAELLNSNIVNQRQSEISAEWNIEGWISVVTGRVLSFITTKLKIKIEQHQRFGPKKYILCFYISSLYVLDL